MKNLMLFVALAVTTFSSLSPAQDAAVATPAIVPTLITPTFADPNGKVPTINGVPGRGRNKSGPRFSCRRAGQRSLLRLRIGHDRRQCHRHLYSVVQADASARRHDGDAGFQHEESRGFSRSLGMVVGREGHSEFPGRRDSDGQREMRHSHHVDSYDSVTAVGGRGGRTFLSARFSWDA